jgi:TDG/mug DNA glycosylase family protein
MDEATVEAYERGAADYVRLRRAYGADRAEAFAASLPDGSLRLDLGSGPGHYLPHLGRPVVEADASHAMVAAALTRAAHGGRAGSLAADDSEPEVPAPHPATAAGASAEDGGGGLYGVVCDLEAVPFRRGAFGGVWASKSLQHVPAERLPLALAGLHRAIEVGGVLDVTVFTGEGEGTTDAEDEFPGRYFSWWEPEALRRVLIGAGFEVDEVEVGAMPEDGHARLTAVARRARTLADTVGPGMRLLICGLNPSIYAADAGVGFARPGNRFWPAALAAGIVSVDRDPAAALRLHGVGMTDVVKRATVAAAELTNDEYKAGLDRVGQLVEWLRPGAICFVGLAGWRAAVDRKATSGIQPQGLGGVPVYVMPSTSGLNARVPLSELTDHLRAAATLADQAL